MKHSTSHNLLVMSMGN